MSERTWLEAYIKDQVSRAKLREDFARMYETLWPQGEHDIPNTRPAGQSLAPAGVENPGEAEP